jgi:hypothetical protein
MRAMNDDLPDDDLTDLAVSLPPLVPPVGDGYMPLYCAAQWIATEGNGRIFDPTDTENWRPAFRDLLGAIASGHVRVTGIADRHSAPVPAHLFAGIQVAYPMVMTPLDLLFSNELVLQSSPYVDEEHWSKGSGDALADRWGTHWRRLMVEKGDVRSRWPFDHQAEEMTAGRTGMQTGAPGAPSSMHLVIAEFERRMQDNEVLPTLAAEARVLEKWQDTGLRREDRHATAKTIENRIRAAHRRYRSSQNEAPKPTTELSTS